MIGLLPQSLEIDGEQYEINSDFRVALLIFEAYSDTELSYYEQAQVCLQCLYKKMPKNTSEALKKAVWFLDGVDMPKSKQAPRKMMDWQQDESIIFPALNKVAGYEIRTTKYLHWWTFLGLFNEVGEGLYSNVMNIRAKKMKHKKLDKGEQEFYNIHKELIDLKVQLTPDQQKELDFVNSLIQ